MSKKTLGKLINDYIVLIVGVPLIIGIHYGWMKLQDVPSLVDQAHKRELPIISMYKSVKNKMIEKFLGENSENNTTEAEEK